MALLPGLKILQFLSQYLLAMMSKLNMLFKLGHAFPKSLLSVDPHDGFCACGLQKKQDVTEQWLVLGHRSHAHCP